LLLLPPLPLPNRRIAVPRIASAPHRRFPLAPFRSRRVRLLAPASSAVVPSVHCARLAVVHRRRGGW